jgi:demethylmenaquinone methyltransferase/2-methoxy-6-polyprenyl-1,4-benzoquinol methylase
MPATVDKSSGKVRDMFAQIAPRYDLMNHLLSLNIDRWWRSFTVSTVPPIGADPILDVCTGTGDLALAYHDAAKGEVQITGVDFCREMLDIAEQKKTDAKIGDQVTFQEGDALNLAFPDDRFQIVSVAFGLRNVADTDRGIAELTRVCKPGGRVAVLEFSVPQWPPLSWLYGFYFHTVLPRVGQWFTSGSHDAYRYLPESVREFPSGEALAERMRAAGLEKVEFHPLTFGIATLYVGHKKTMNED